ncbi:ribose 5-phosphate isomerase B [Mycoplasmatota bacterium]|nr:ribose 5-phosphate isomerase B [Mycoplasmatota bacterium]
MRIVIGCDHGGYVLKKKIIAYLEENNITFEDVGSYSEESVDYPEYARKVAKKVTSGKFDRGILLCGTGIGISIAANKVKGARCALVHDVESASLTRQHNDSNILAMGGRIVDHNLALEIVKIWLSTDFEGGRHLRRVNSIEEV